MTRSLARACAALALLAPALRAGEVNVARSTYGTTATASSRFPRGDYGPENAIDGKWNDLESDKWNSAVGQDREHYLVLDFARKRTITRIVIRNEGILPRSGHYNTSDYALQAAEAPEGPWRDLIEPVRGNTKNVTDDRFGPTETRYVRLLITKAEQNGNRCARIFEVEAYAPADTVKDEPAREVIARVESRLADATIHLVQSSHHDLGWHKGSYPAETKFTCDEINAALDLMKEDPDFTFTGECTVWLWEYVKRHPDRVEELKQRFREGRMEWGAGYTMPYTSLLTGEQLARQMYFGARWFNRTFPARATIYFNTDVPGFGLQMPQILRKSGVDKAFLSRSWNLTGIETEFLDWAAQDGTDVFCYMMHHYGNHVGAYRKKKMGDNRRIVEWIRSQEEHYAARKIPHELVLFLCMDCRMPELQKQNIESWNEYASAAGLGGMRCSTLAAAMDAVNAEGADFRKVRGEWPSKWLYEAAPANYELVSDQRESDRLLRAAEAFSTFRALVEGGFGDYPADALAAAWRKGVFACHGFAPDSVIGTYRETYRAARDAGDELLRDALGAITRRVQTAPRGVPLVVFNTLSWDRTDVVELPLPASAPAAFHVLGPDGGPAAHQLTRDGRLVFLAERVPSMGYSTYCLAEGAGEAYGAASVRPGAAWTAAFENAFFKIEPGRAGLRQVVDRELGRELLDTAKFEGAEWLDFEYKGQGAGEHTHITMPTPHGFDRLANYGVDWRCVEAGPVRTTFETAQVATPRGKVRLRLTAYAALKRLDLACEMLGCDEEPARQTRLAFPLRADPGRIAYEVPFGVVEVGTSELGPGLARGKAAVRPREVQSWIHAGDGTGGVTIGSSVVAWDYADASQGPVDYPVLQPVLLCSAYSCSRWKRAWTQPGDHAFTFSIHSHGGGWRDGYRLGVASRSPLIAIEQKGRSREADLPETRSFLAVSPANVIVTAVKKAEDGDDFVVRFYETEGRDRTSARITSAARLSRARRTNLIEEDAGELRRTPHGAALDVGPFSIETLRLTPEPGR